jgi:hypothetical protein
VNLIEQLFGVAPDGGNGTFELALLAGIAFLLAVRLRRTAAGIITRLIRS